MSFGANARAWCLAGLVLAAGAMPSLAQAPPAGGPKSLLPDDFDETPPAVVEGPAAIHPGSVGGFAPVPLPPAEPAVPEVAEVETPDPLVELAGPTMRPELAGVLVPATGGLAPTLFDGGDSRFLATLLDRIESPLASRWAQILLTRALLSVQPAPPPLNPADWVAARGAALAAIGAGADAHRMVMRIAIDGYTSRLYAVAAQAALASADPMALCPLSPTARLVLDTPTWILADAMCLSILGDDVGSSILFDRLRRRNLVDGFDIGLAERVASAAGGGRRGANPEWSELGALTAWRIGLAAAAGLDLPDDRIAAAAPAQKAWIARLPGVSIGRRAQLAPEAAAIGALSSAEINRILAAEAATLAAGQVAGSPGGQLRTAHAAPKVAERIAAMKALWGRARPGTPAHYGWQVATAPAAARIPPATGLADEAAAIVASLNAAGIVQPAARWWAAVREADADARAAAWAQLVAVSPAVPLERDLYDRWARTVSPHRAQLLAAGLRGLGRGSLGPDSPALDNDWTRALDRAVAARRPGEVILLVAAGLQGSWAEVPPDYLRRIAAALVAVGHAAEARLIVAEAANRG